MSKNESKQPEKNLSEQKQDQRRPGRSLTMEEMRQRFPNHPLCQVNSIIIGSQVPPHLKRLWKKKQMEETKTKTKTKTGEVNALEKQEEE